MAVKKAERNVKNKKTTKHPGGAPRTYTDAELIDMVGEYRNEWMRQWDAGLTKLPPTVTRCAIYIDVAKSTLYERAKTSKELSNSLERLTNLSEATIFEGALMGDYNSNISKLMLNNYGVTDQPQHEQQTDNVVKVVIEQADYGD